MDPDLKEHLVHESLEGIVVTDLDGSILECNTTAMHLLGYPETDLKHEHVGILFPPASTSYLLPNLIHIAVNEGGFRGEVMLQNADNQAVMVQLHANGYPARQPDYILFRFIDWRETREIMRQLRESSQMAILGSLTRSMAHEIINPLSVIGVYTRKLLDSSFGTATEGEWIRHVRSNIEKLEAIIDSVQTYMNLPEASFTLASPWKILDKAVRSYEAETEDHGIRIQIKTHETLPDIYLDPVLFEMAVKAALSNSIHRMPRGGDLMLTGSLEESNVCIVIEDSGPFLDNNQLEEDLSPIHVASNDKIHLNLAIARRIVHEHSGTFHLGLSEFGGIKVKFTLPRDRRSIVRHRIL